MAVDPRTLMAKYGQRAKKSWGQNFLIDEKAYRSIVEGTAATAEDTVLEIGAGLGTLTLRLAESAGHVIAIERDRELAEILRVELATMPNIELREANALTFDYAELASTLPRPLLIVGNLPYNIATPILFRLFAQRRRVRRIVVMLQREMADRIASPANGDNYGALSAMVQLYGEPKIICKVKAGGFVPAPKVDSAVLRIELFADGTTRVPIVDEANYSAVVHAAFNQRRKTLRNALSSLHEDVTGWLQRGEIDPQRRGETLSVAEFARIANLLEPKTHA